MSFESFNQPVPDSEAPKKKSGNSLLKRAALFGAMAAGAAGVVGCEDEDGAVKKPEQETKHFDQRTAEEKAVSEARRNEIKEYLKQPHEAAEGGKQTTVNFLKDKGMEVSIDEVGKCMLVHNIPIEVYVKGEKVKITTADYTNRELEELRGVMQEKLKAIDTPSVQQNFQVHAEYVRERNILREIGIEESSQEQRAAPASQEKPSSTRQGTNLDNVKDW